MVDLFTLFAWFLSTYLATGTFLVATSKKTQGDSVLTKEVLRRHSLFVSPCVYLQHPSCILYIPPGYPFLFQKKKSSLKKAPHKPGNFGHRQKTEKQQP
jgi:hypothetical protein